MRTVHWLVPVSGSLLSCVADKQWFSVYYYPKQIRVSPKYVTLLKTSAVRTQPGTLPVSAQKDRLGTIARIEVSKVD